jgi:amino acid transporter
MLGYVLVLGVIFVYIAANVGLTVYFWTKERSEFNWILHFVFPIGTSLVLIYSVYAAFTPFPAAPNNWTPVVAGGWLLLGIAVVLWKKMTGDVAWLSKVAEVVSEREETATEEAAGRPL